MTRNIIDVLPMPNPMAKVQPTFAISRPSGRLGPQIGGIERDVQAGNLISGQNSRRRTIPLPKTIRARSPSA
jgi:hypothetical protein